MPNVWKNKVRQDLYDMWAEQGYTVGAEVGVLDGRNSKAICKAIPGVKIYCIDPWESYHRRPNQYEQDRHFEKATARLKPYPNAEIIKMRSLDAVKLFKDESLDFVYLDGDHKFDSIMSELIQWSPKVRMGGTVSGHDYKNKLQDVITAVDAYTAAHGIKFWITNDGTPSFFWKKECGKERDEKGNCLLHGQ